MLRPPSRVRFVFRANAVGKLSDGTQHEEQRDKRFDRSRHAKLRGYLCSIYINMAGSVEELWGGATSPQTAPTHVKKKRANVSVVLGVGFSRSLRLAARGDKLHFEGFP